MAFLLVLALLVLMAGTRGRGGTRGRRGTSKRTRTAGEAGGSDPDYQESSPEETEATAHLDKGKGIAGESSRGGGSRAREARTKHGSDVPPARRRLFESKSCIAERMVNFNDLIRDVPEFGRLLQRAPIEPVGRVPAKAPFCVELIREFYMNGKVLAEDDETGTFIFETTVRQRRLPVTPYDIGEILGMNVDTTGLLYTSGGFQSSTHMDLVLGAICKPGVFMTRGYIESKDLLPEYHLLSLVMSYNVQPTIGTKRLRWDRLVLLYLLGHPDQTYGLNINIPFLIWQRMAHVIQGATRRDLLPFPIMITRILQARGIDTSCEKYDVGLGPIDSVTWAKSVSTLKTFQQAKVPPPEASSPAPPPRASSSSAPPRPSRGSYDTSSSSGGPTTLESVKEDLRKLKKKVNNIGRKVESNVKKFELSIKRLMDKMGCRHDDIWTPAPSGYTTYRRSTSRHPLIPPSPRASGDAPEGSRAGAGDDDDDDDEETE